MGSEPTRIHRFGAFALDVAEQRLLQHGRPVALTPKAFDLLRVLVENAGHLVTKDRLLQEVWPDAFVEEGNLNRTISILRKKLGESSSERYIETIPKRGYRFVAPLEQRALPETPAPPARPEISHTTPGSGEPTSRARRLAAAGAALAGIVVVGTMVSALLSSGRVEVGAGYRRDPAHRQLTFAGREVTPALSPDGRRIAYVSTSTPERMLMVRSVERDDAVAIFRAPEIGSPRWSPDGRELLVWARGAGTDGVHVVDADGSGARRVAAGLAVACWSPDGSAIALGAFVASRIIVVDRLGAVIRTLELQETRRDWIWDLDWTAAGDRLLVVTADKEGRPAVWTVGSNGTGQRRAFTAPAEILAARWAAGGRAIYYFGRANQTVSLYKIEIDPEAGSPVPVPLLTGLQTDEGFGITADGSRLVYARAPYHSNLWLVDADDVRPDASGGSVQLTHATSVIERPRVSPDGKSILFSMGYESRADLFTMPAEGGRSRQLTFLNALSLGGVWSPDGRSVAFASNAGGATRIWTVNGDGSSPRPLEADGVSSSFDLAWSPGPRLLYQQIGFRNYAVLTPGASAASPLVADPTVGWISAPVYSPDGATLAVGWNRRPARGIWTIDTRTGRDSLVLPAARDSSALPIGWSPDGAYIYAYDGKRAAYRGVSVPFELTMTDARVFRVPARGGTPEPVVKLPFAEVGSVTVFPDGRRFVCAVYTAQSDIWLVDDFDRPASRLSASADEIRR